MPMANEEIRITILLGTLIILLFGIGFVFLFSIFSKKNQLNRQEKEILKATYEKTILQSQLEIQEQTLNEISQEIHDNVGQILSLAKVQINIMHERPDRGPEMLIGIKENIGKAMTDLRDIARSLSSERIQSLGIHDTIAHEVER